MGQRATVSGSAVFDDVAVDPALVIPYQHAFEVPQQLGARAQLVHAAIQTGIAGGALRDAGDSSASRARPFFEAASGGWAQRAGDDPHTIHRYGRLATRVRAAEALLARAAATRRIDRRPRTRGGGARLDRGRAGQGVRQRGRGRGGQRPVRAQRRERRRRAPRPEPALA